MSSSPSVSNRIFSFKGTGFEHCCDIPLSCLGDIGDGLCNTFEIFKKNTAAVGLFIDTVSSLRWMTYKDDSS